MKPLLVSDDFERFESFGLIVPHLDHLAEGALADDGEDFVPKQHVIVKNDGIVAALIVVACVRGCNGIDLMRA
jgi:hypothetical protein